MSRAATTGIGPQPSGRAQRSFLITFPLGHFANDCAPSAVWLLAPAIAISMGLSPAEVGLLIAIHAIGASLGYLPAGILADHAANRGRLLMATFWWVAAGYFVASFAPGFWSLALLMALAGMGDAAWHPIATGVLVQSLPGRRAQALGIHAVGGSLAEVVAPLAVGFLLVHLDWRGALQVSVIPAVLMGLYFLLRVRQVPPSPDGAMSWADLRGLVRIWRSKQGFLLVLLISLYNMALMAMMAMTPLYLQTERGFSSSVTGAIFATMLLVGALAQPLTGRLSDAVGRKPVILAGNLIAGAGAALLPLAWGTAGLVALLILVVAMLVAIRSVVLAAAIDFVGKREGTTLGLAFVLLDGVGALGSVAAGAAGSLALHYAFVLAAAFSFGAATLALFTRLSTRGA